MKKNITINLCGRLFQIDEDAYELLQQYVESLRSYFGRQEGGEEIVDDIEARIAELFDELRQQGTEAITIDHVKGIITRIGEPEQMTDEDNANDNPNANDNANGNDKEGHRYDSFRSAADGIRESIRERTKGKRLYRNPNDKVLAGVLSGLAAYTDTDATFWRVGFVLLTFAVYPFLRIVHLFYGFPSVCFALLLIYLVLALLVPEAKKPEQVLEMEGKDVTPQNLADVVVDEKKPAQQQRSGCLGSFLSVIFTFITGFFVGIAAIIGVVLLVCLFLIVISVIIVFTVPGATRLSLPFDIGYLNLPELYAAHPWIVIAFVVSLLVALFVPLYAIVHMLLSKSGKTQPMGIGQRILWIVLWVAALCCMIPSLIWIQERASERYMAEYARTHSYQGVQMSNDDMTFLRRGGWNLLKAENCAHYTYSGDYYNGDSDTRYLDAWNQNCEEVYQAERREAVEPGIYRLTCIGRAEGPGPCIYALGEKKYIQPIPVYGDKGGELAEQISSQLAENQASLSDSLVSKERSHVRMKIMGIEFEVDDDELKINGEAVDQYRVKEGMGWSVVTIDNIVVTGDSVAYGVSTDATFTGQPCRAQWFSATDFKLTRTGNLKSPKH